MVGCLKPTTDLETFDDLCLAAFSSIATFMQESKNFHNCFYAVLPAYGKISLGPGLCLYALNLGEDNSIVIG